MFLHDPIKHLRRLKPSPYILRIAVQIDYSESFESSFRREFNSIFSLSLSNKRNKNRNPKGSKIAGKKR